MLILFLAGCETLEKVRLNPGLVEAFSLISHHEQPKGTFQALRLPCAPQELMAQIFQEEFGEPIGEAMGRDQQYYLAVYQNEKEWALVRYNVNGLGCLLADGPGTIRGVEQHGEQL